MKSVLISIQPKWCELIASGKKTVEVRKTAPKLETPFKVYIYCTKGRGEALWKYRGVYYYDTQFPNERPNTANGKVIGEFVCDRITPTTKDHIKQIAQASCLSLSEMWEYGKKSSAYDLLGWHISDLVIYDEPKELNSFMKPYGSIIRAFDSCYIQRAPQSWCYVEG